MCMGIGQFLLRLAGALAGLLIITNTVMTAYAIVTNVLPAEAASPTLTSVAFIGLSGLALLGFSLMEFD